MHESAAVALLAVNKHHVVGIIAIVIGALLVLLGAARLFGKLAIGAIVPLAGLVLLVLGILLYLRVF